MSIKGQHIDEYFEEDPPPNAGQAVLAVFELLSKKIAVGEIEHGPEDSFSAVGAARPSGQRHTSAALLESSGGTFVVNCNPL